MRTHRSACAARSFHHTIQSELIRSIDRRLCMVATDLSKAHGCRVTSGKLTPQISLFLELLRDSVWHRFTAGVRRQGDRSGQFFHLTGARTGV